MEIKLNKEDIILINELFQVANIGLEFGKTNDNTIIETTEKKQKDLFNLKEKINNQINNIKI